MNKIAAIAILFLFVLTTCKEKYDPAVKSTSQSYLVVDGNLNPTDTTFIHLSRTIKIDSSIALNPELKASITIEGQNNSIYILSEQKNGIYILPASGLNIGNAYRLRITTSGGKQYLSDFITIKDNPAIDSINWVRNNLGVSINMNTHDPQNKSIYYRWEYDETYEIHTFYTSEFIYKNGIISRRVPSEYVNICYKWFSTSNIVLASTAKLQTDIISQVPIIFIPDNSEKLSVRYSVLVRQYVLSKQAFDYLQIVKKNTESIGNVFGVLPAEVTGNIHGLSDPNEQIIGFLTGSPVQLQRIFIKSSDLPGWFFKQACGLIWAAGDPVTSKNFLEYYLIVDDKPSPTGFPGYNFTDPPCADCRLRGGILTKHSFW